MIIGPNVPWKAAQENTITVIEMTSDVSTALGNLKTFSDEPSDGISDRAPSCRTIAHDRAAYSLLWNGVRPDLDLAAYRLRISRSNSQHWRTSVDGMRPTLGF